MYKKAFLVHLTDVYQMIDKFRESAAVADKPARRVVM